MFLWERVFALARDEGCYRADYSALKVPVFFVYLAGR